MSVLDPPVISYRLEYSKPNKPDMIREFISDKNEALYRAQLLAEDYQKQIPVYEMISSNSGMRYQTITSRRILVEPKT